jgi:hypothetical protein
MSIQDLGSLGELIASIGVVISLIYLAVQIRQSTRATRLASRQAILDRFSQASADLARRPHMLTVIGKSVSGFDNLTDSEKAILNHSLLPYVGNLYNALLLRQDGLMDDEPFEYIANAFISYVLTPGGQQWWREPKGVVPTSLIAFVEQRIASGSLPGMPPGYLDLSREEQVTATFEVPQSPE